MSDQKQNGAGKRQRVTDVRCKVAVQAHGGSFSSFVAGRDAAEMELHPVGVSVRLTIRGGMTKELLVPYANITHVGLETESERTARESTEAKAEAKRKEVQ